MFDREAFADQVAIVNGGTRGLGREIAVRLAAAGATVVITGRTRHQGQETVAAANVAADRDAAGFVQMDATVEAEIEHLHEKVLALGGFHLAVNNLGVEDTPAAPLADSTEEAFDRCVTTKARAAYLGMKHQIRHFQAAGTAGAIVNVSSMIGLGGHAGVPAYTAANGAVQALTRTVAMEVAAAGIRVNCICPGAMTGSPMLYRFTGGSDGSAGGEDAAAPGSAYAGYVQNAAHTYPMGRLPETNEVAEAVLFLLSPAAGAVTGHCLPAEGGFMLNLAR